MEQYISKDAIVAEIEKRIKEISKECEESKTIQFTLIGKINALENLLPFLNTIEVKDANEAIRTEYEKGRADIIEKTLKWLWDLNQEHEIMSYTDSHVLSSDELQQYYKNNIEQ